MKQYKSDKCLMQVNKYSSLAISFSAGFLIFDLIGVIFVYEMKNSLLWQSIFHHIIAISWFFSSMYQGFGAPAICSAGLIAEFSSIFLNYKEFFNVETRNTGLGLFNNLSFVFTFTVLRPLGGPIAIFY